MAKQNLEARAKALFGLLKEDKALESNLLPINLKDAIVPPVGKKGGEPYSIARYNTLLKERGKTAAREYLNGLDKYLKNPLRQEFNRLLISSRNSRITEEDLRIIVY